MGLIFKAVFTITIATFLFLSFPSAPTLAAGERLFKMGEDVVVEEGMHVRSVCVLNGQATISGHVHGNVMAINGSVVLTRKAVVKGNVLSLGGVVVIARGATIEGKITEINSARLSETITNILSNEWEGWSWLAALFSLAVFLCTLLVGIFLVVLIPTPIERISQVVVSHFWKSLFAGILVLILIVPLAALLTISVIGIILIPLEIILVAITAFLGLVGVSHRTGDFFYRACKKISTQPVGRFVWGLVLIWLIGWIPIVGWMVKVFLITLGMGAAILTRFGTFSPQRQAT
ncbi:MAG: polymer-forming cytoskeletal protein [Syntrophales bacterium]|nr:polymer-forming cytoskeletal protein [Syntrophales bacterium]